MQTVIKRTLPWLLALAILACFIPYHSRNANATTTAEVTITVPVNTAKVNIKKADMYYSSTPNQPITIKNGAITTGENNYTKVQMNASGKNVSVTTSMPAGEDGKVAFYLVIIAQDIDDIYHIYAFETEKTDSGATFTAKGGVQTLSTSITSGLSFVAASAEITTAVTPSNSGTVTGGGYYGYEKNAILTAIPKQGYKFVKWSDSANTQNPRTVQVTADATYTAEFAKQLSVNITGTGVESVSKTGLDSGATATLTVKAKNGYYFSKAPTVSGATVTTTTFPAEAITVQVTNVTDNVSFTVNAEAYLAKIGTTYYGTTQLDDLVKALGDAASGTQVQFGATANITTPVQIPKGVVINGTALTEDSLVTVKDGEATIVTAEAKIGTKLYATLADALTAAAANTSADTIILTQDTVTAVTGQTLKAGDKIQKKNGDAYTAVDDVAVSVDKDANITLTADQGKAVITAPAGGTATKVTNPADSGQQITVEAGKPATGESKIGVKEGGKVTIGEPGATYTCPAASELVIDKNGKVNLNKGKAELDEGEAIYTTPTGGTATKITNTNPAASGKKIVVEAGAPNADESTLTVPAGGEVTVGDPGTKYTNAQTDKDLTLVIDGKGEARLEKGEVYLPAADPDAKINITAGDKTYPVINPGTDPLLVTNNPPADATVTLNKDQVAVIDGHKFIGGEPTGSVITIDDKGIHTKLEPGQTINIDGAIYTGDEPDGAEITIDEGGVHVEGNYKITLTKDLITDPGYTLLPGVPVSFGGYTYLAPETGNTGAVTIHGFNEATGNPIVIVEKAGDALNVAKTSDAESNTDYKAAGANTQFTMTNPEAKADDSQINLLGATPNVSGLTVTGKAPVTVDGVTYTGGSDDSAYTVLYGTKEIAGATPEDPKTTVPSHKVTLTSGNNTKVSATLGSRDLHLDVTNTKVNGNDVAGEKHFTTASAPATIVIAKDAKGETNTAAGSRSRVKAGEEANNFVLTRTSSGGGSNASVETTDDNSTIKVKDPDHGAIKVSPSTATVNTKVTITVTPDKGYDVDNVTATDKNGNKLTLTDLGNNKFSFTQPAAALQPVTVNATFKTNGEEPGTATGLPFTDVAAGDWYKEAVTYVYDKGLMSGASANSFSPNLATTRGMIVTILYRLEGLPAVTNASGFADVAAGQYYADAVAWAAANGVVTGYSSSSFGPNDTITREQMAAILYRYASYKGYDDTKRADLTAYTDHAAVSSYALTALQWANAEKLVNGFTATTLAPAGNATRAQVATLLMRFCENIVTE